MRVLIADDHPIVRMGLRALLESDPSIEVVGEAGDGAAAVEAAAALQPDVVLMDLRMPILDGVEATARITAEGPIAVLIVTTYESDSDIVRAIEAGAVGYVLKDTPRGQLLEAIARASRHESTLAPSVAARLMRRTAGPTHAVLTPREIEVLACVADGLSNAETGRRLHIGEATVKTHLLRVFVKLGVDDRTAAVTTAMRDGILPPPGT